MTYYTSLYKRENSRAIVVANPARGAATPVTSRGNPGYVPGQPRLCPGATPVMSRGNLSESLFAYCLPVRARRAVPVLLFALGLQIYPPLPLPAREGLG